MSINSVSSTSQTGDGIASARPTSFARTPSFRGLFSASTSALSSSSASVATASALGGRSVQPVLSTVNEEEIPQPPPETPVEPMWWLWRFVLFCVRAVTKHAVSLYLNSVMRPLRAAADRAELERDLRLVYNDESIVATTHALSKGLVKLFMKLLSKGHITRAEQRSSLIKPLFYRDGTFSILGEAVNHFVRNKKNLKYVEDIIAINLLLIFKRFTFLVGKIEEKKPLSLKLTIHNVLAHIISVLKADAKPDFSTRLDENVLANSLIRLLFPANSANINLEALGWFKPKEFIFAIIVKAVHSVALKILAKESGEKAQLNNFEQYTKALNAKLSQTKLLYKLVKILNNVFKENKNVQTQPQKENSVSRNHSEFIATQPISLTVSPPSFLRKCIVHVASKQDGADKKASEKAIALLTQLASNESELRKVIADDSVHLRRVVATLNQNIQNPAALQATIQEEINFQQVIKTFIESFFSSVSPHNFVPVYKTKLLPYMSMIAAKLSLVVEKYSLNEIVHYGFKFAAQTGQVGNKLRSRAEWLLHGKVIRNAQGKYRVTLKKAEEYRKLLRRLNTAKDNLSKKYGYVKHLIIPKSGFWNSVKRKAVDKLSPAAEITKSVLGDTIESLEYDNYRPLPAFIGLKILVCLKEATE